MIIVEKDKELKVSLAINEYFKTEAEKVSISDTFDGDQFEGMVSFSEGDYDITATRVEM